MGCFHPPRTPLRTVMLADRTGFVARRSAMTAVVDQDAAAARPSVAPGELWIGGQPQAAADGATRTILDPATGQPVTAVAEGGAQDVARAVAAARAAADSGVWSAMAPRARAEVLARVA